MKIVKENKVLKESTVTIIFNGKNFDDLKAFIEKNKVKASVVKDTNNKVTLTKGNDSQTVFKDDLIAIDQNEIFVYKPKYSM